MPRPTTSTSASSRRSQSRRRAVRRRTSFVGTGQDWHRARHTIKAAAITLCYWSQIAPTAQNLRRARNTLYEWTRNLATEPYTSLTLSQLLNNQIQTACLAGTPLFEIVFIQRRPYGGIKEHTLSVAQLNQLAIAYWNQKVKPWYEYHTQQT